MLHLMRLKNKRIKTIWWFIIIATVVTFVGGFVFLLGAGLDSTYRARLSGALGTVDGESITRVEYQNALQEQRELYRRQYGQEPTDRDQKAVETQTWRSLVVQRLLDGVAAKVGLKAYDPEVVLAMQTSPPAILASAPAFQTDGKFDPEKYRAALSDPNNNWSAFEDMARRQIPMRKLQERMVSSLKVSEPELLAAYRYQFERVRATVVQVPPDAGDPAPVPEDTEIQRAHETYGSLFADHERARAEVAAAEKQYGDEEIGVARELAQSLVDRANQGEDFAALARDYSEGAAADKGGVVDRTFRPEEFGELAARASVSAPGTVLGPVQDRGRFLLFKVLERPALPDGGGIGLRVAQIVIRVRPNDDALRQQFQDVHDVRKEASKGGLGRAAATRGIPTMDTGFFTLDNPPQALAGVPEAVDWALSAKEGEVSPVFEGPDEFVILQVTTKRPSGVPGRDEITDQLTQLAVLDMRVDRARPTADQIVQAVNGGASLEQAARAAGLEAQKTEPMARLAPDQRFSDASEMLGALFAARPGRVVGPFRSTAGWYVARLDESFPADTTFFQQIKGQLSSDLMQRRQQTFLSNWVETLREKAQIEDLRSDPNQ